MSLPAADGGCRAGVGVVNEKIGVPKPEGRGGGTQHALLRLAGQGGEIEPGRMVGLLVRAFRLRPGAVALSRAGSNHAVQKLTVGLCQALRHAIPLSLIKFAPFRTGPRAGITASYRISHVDGSRTGATAPSWVSMASMRRRYDDRCEPGGGREYAPLGLQNAVSTLAVLAYRHGLPRPFPGTAAGSALCPLSDHREHRERPGSGAGRACRRAASNGGLRSKS
jgi:hypothetical protein